jgi:3-oxoacyl-[acyl-carrier-protein] synthase-1
MRLAIGQYTATSAAGTGLAALHASISNRRSGVRDNDLPGCDLETWIGRVEGVEAVSLPEALRHLGSRNNQLAWLGLKQDEFLHAIEKTAAQIGAERVGVILGTSTSSIGSTELAYKQLTDDGRMPKYLRVGEIHSLHSPAHFVAEAACLKGPAVTISTACSSSAKVFATASRWIQSGIVDAALVGGVDSLCGSILYGFNSLELLSASPCRPCDVRRDGINIGEACGYALVARPDLLPDAEFHLLGYGESADAWHMSHPHPEGKGAEMSMQLALQRAGVEAFYIDYINMHGTATQANDRIESLALSRNFSESTLASSTKGWTGHALGAAGILEAVITLESMRHGLVPGTLNCEQPDSEFAFPALQENGARSIRYSMSNSFGFGGNNASLLFGRAND